VTTATAATSNTVPEPGATACDAIADTRQTAGDCTNNTLQAASNSAYNAHNTVSDAFKNSSNARTDGAHGKKFELLRSNLSQHPSSFLNLLLILSQLSRQNLHLPFDLVHES